MGRDLGLAELGNNAELDQLGLKLWLNWSQVDFLSNKIKGLVNHDHLVVSNTMST